LALCSLLPALGLAQISFINLTSLSTNVTTSSALITIPGLCTNYTYTVVNSNNLVIGDTLPTAFGKVNSSFAYVSNELVLLAQMPWQYNTNLAALIGVQSNLLAALTNQITAPVTSFSDTVDAFDYQNQRNFGANQGIVQLMGPGFGAVFAYTWTPGLSIIVNHKNAAIFARMGRTNFNAAFTLSGTNVAWCFTNIFAIRFMTNGGPSGFGAATVLSAGPAVNAGLGDQFVTTNFYFSVPYGIVTNLVGIYTDAYNAGGSNELWLNTIISN
jgi:hypothetical protein